MSTPPLDPFHDVCVSTHGHYVPHKGFWLFGYGSLMWQPGFKYAARRHAVLRGYHRSLCVYSWRYRGTKEKPGLVFGLDRGGHTKGIAYRVRAQDSRRVFEQVFAREMPTKVYRPTWLPLNLTDGCRRTVQALCFVTDIANPQYTGRLTDAETVGLVKQGFGTSGPCTDYVLNTLTCLRAQGIRDLSLERIAGKLGL